MSLDLYGTSSNAIAQGNRIRRCTIQI